MMRSSYAKEDVCLLLKDITGLVEPLPAAEREKLIQEGKHYCEMLPIEYEPSKAYMEAYQKALEGYAKAVARAVGVLGDKIIGRKGKDVVLVSLARAGTPVGILLKHYLQKKYGCAAMHYSISIIRERGIDPNAMAYLLAHHRPQQLQFVDGWIGKGAILEELRSALRPYPGVSAELGVIADPACATQLCGTHEDLLIPSSCLNCTVSGLISRTFLRKDIIGEHDFHGAVFYENLRDKDLSYAFLDAIEKEFVFDAHDNRGENDGDCACDCADFSGEIQEKLRAEEIQAEKESRTGKGQENESESIRNSEKENPGMEEVKKIAARFGVENIYLVKPGIGETTRVLLRRVPWRVLIDPRYREDPSVAHILRLARDKEVLVEEYSMKHYKACGIIKKMADT